MRLLFKHRLAEEGQVIMPSGRRLDDGNTIRVLYLYDTLTQNRYGDAQIQSMIAAGHATSNQALINSGLTFQLQSAGILSVAYVDTSFSGALSDLAFGVVPNVKALRTQYKADLVQMVIENTASCG